ncbi:hypothetical protein [Variovorax atrisoli]|uniref:hypothetical protein n=1 Tax=Variovorax atrisoli TaxID=3394203 RepID=UPI000380319A|nr:hypothetical protein [Variovorax paradoxus]
MSLLEDALPVGAPFAIGAVLYAALQAALEPQGVKTLNNPVRASSLKDGARIVFYEDVSDRPDRSGDQPGGQPKRTFSFNLCAINRAEGAEAARRGSHEDYRAAKRVVRDALKGLRQAVMVTSVLREGDVTYRIENIDVGGGLILGTFSVDYRDPS